MNVTVGPPVWNPDREGGAISAEDRAGGAVGVAFSFYTSRKQFRIRSMDLEILNLSHGCKSGFENWSNSI